MEVGLGGRLDSTNVIHPLLTIITNIGHDHMHILGSSLTEIAGEKAGIIKNGVPLITAEVKQEPLNVLNKLPRSGKLAYINWEGIFPLSTLVPIEKKELFSLDTVYGSYFNLRTSLLGEHQLTNASLAVMAAKLLETFYSFIHRAGTYRDRFR